MVGPASARPRATVGGRLVAALGLLLLLGGAGLALDFIPVSRAQADYQAAPRCAQPAQMLTEPCFAELTATVAGVRLTFESDGAPHREIALTEIRGLPIPDSTFETITPNRVYYQLRPGDHVLLRLWMGRAVTVRVDSAVVHNNRTMQDGNTRLRDSPLADQYSLLQGGASLAVVGVILLYVALPSRPFTGWLERLLGRPLAGPLMAVGVSPVQAVLHDRLLRIAFAVVMVTQAGDVASSIIGTHAGLFEQNPINQLLLMRFGDLGFVLLKVPALILVLLLLPRLPRRLALAVAVLFAFAYTVVVTENLVQAWELAHGPGLFGQ